MRKVTYGGAVSLDGFLAGPGEAIDWLRWSDDSAKIAAESFRGVDAMLMGRKTFEFAQKMGGGPPTPGVTTYVFSRTLEALPEGADGVLVSEDTADFVRRLKDQPGGGIVVMGGGELGSALLEAGLVDEIGASRSTRSPARRRGAGLRSVREPDRAGADRDPGAGAGVRAGAVPGAGLARTAAAANGRNVRTRHGGCGGGPASEGGRSQESHTDGADPPSGHGRRSAGSGKGLACGDAAA